MPPIVSGAEVVPLGSPMVVALVVTSSATVALGLALLAVMCGCCGGDKKPEEMPATDEKSAKNPETPPPPSEPETGAPKSETKEPPAKGPASVKSDKPEQSIGSGATMKMQKANDLQLMSAVDGGKSYGKAGGDTKTRMSNQPSLVLAGQSTVQDGKGAAAPSSKAKTDASNKAGGASVTLDPAKTKTDVVSQTAKTGKTSKKGGGADDEATQAPTIKTAKTTKSTTEATTTVGGTTTAATTTVGGTTTAGTTTKATTKTKASKAGKSSASMRGKGGDQSELDQDLNTSASGATTGMEKPGGRKAKA